MVCRHRWLNIGWVIRSIDSRAIHYRPFVCMWNPKPNTIFRQRLYWNVYFVFLAVAHSDIPISRQIARRLPFADNVYQFFMFLLLLSLPMRAFEEASAVRSRWANDWQVNFMGNYQQFADGVASISVSEEELTATGRINAENDTKIVSSISVDIH